MKKYLHIFILALLLGPMLTLIGDETVSFQSGASTFITTFEPDTPHADKHQAGIHYTRLRSPGTRKGLFRWQLDTHPFSDQPVVQVRAYFYCITSRNPGNDPLTAHAMLRTWTPNATWLTSGAEEQWATPGMQPEADYRTDPVGSAQVPFEGGGWLEISLDPGLVESWFRNPAGNHGIMLQVPVNTGPGIDCRFANFATRQTYLQPRLVVAADREAVFEPPRDKAPTDACEYRFYDPAIDPPTLPLDQIRVRYSGYQDTKWGDIPIPARSSWPVWSKNGSLRVLTTREPLTIDKPFYRKDEDFDSWHDTNDNYGGQWFSPDGKTLFFGQSRTVLRFPPYRVDYDNLRQVNRIMVIWSTQDGVLWTPDWFDVPADAESTAFQNYGLRVMKTADPDLMLAYNCAYDQWTQQIYVTFHFSHDGRYWEHLPEHLTFAAPGQPGDWNFGSMFLSGRTVRLNGRALHAIGYATSACHFYHELKHAKARDADAIERRFGNRGLAEHWPYFNSVGGWSGLADDIEQSHYTAGVAEWRQDGWVALHADKAATFTTRPFTNAETLAINAETAKKGSITIEVLTDSGKELAEYCGTNAASFTGDSIRQPVAWKSGWLKTLPPGTFRLRVTLRHADLYALYW